MALQRGWRIHGRNLRLRAGEADLVCVRDSGPGLSGIIVEVKSTGHAGTNLDTRLDPAKRKRLWAMARELADRLDLVEVGVVAVLCVIETHSQQLTWLELDAW
jgi:Holliday junction resolvase-like predicted endonuclease